MSQLYAFPQLKVDTFQRKTASITEDRQRH